VANLALSALTAGTGDSPLRTCVASLPPTFYSRRVHLDFSDTLKSDSKRV
jgi:hypothetical protein